MTFFKDKVDFTIKKHEPIQAMVMAQQMVCLQVHSRYINSSRVVEIDADK